MKKPTLKYRETATLNISGNGDLEMKVYTLGFLALELSSRNGAVKSNPGLDSTKKTILTQGLRDSVFWWDIKDFTVQEEDGFYLLRNAEREITLDKKSGLPTKQQIYFPSGKVLTVYYDNPAREEGILYQSKMKIELSKYSVTLIVKNIASSCRLLCINPQVYRNSLYRGLNYRTLFKEKTFK